MALKRKALDWFLKSTSRSLAVNTAQTTLQNYTHTRGYTALYCCTIPWIQLVTTNRAGSLTTWTCYSSYRWCRRTCFDYRSSTVWFTDIICWYHSNVYTKYLQTIGGFAYSLTICTGVQVHSKKWGVLCVMNAKLPLRSVKTHQLRCYHCTQRCILNTFECMVWLNTPKGAWHSWHTEHPKWCKWNTSFLTVYL